MTTPAATIQPEFTQNNETGGPNIQGAQDTHEVSDALVDATAETAGENEHGSPLRLEELARIATEHALPASVTNDQIKNSNQN